MTWQEPGICPVIITSYLAQCLPLIVLKYESYCGTFKKLDIAIDLNSSSTFLTSTFYGSINFSNYVHHDKTVWVNYSNYVLLNIF